MKFSIEIEKNILNQYGKVINYSEFREDEIQNKLIEGFKYRLIYLIKESEIKQFTTSINNQDGTIQLTGSIQYRTSSIKLKKKIKNYLEVELCVQGTHFIPDKILKDDILFFFKRYKNNTFFMIVKDEYINEMLYSEHSIFGIVDFCKGTHLLFEKDSSINPKMEIFHREINKIAREYSDILFITISDSILIKHSFQIINEEGNLLSSNFDFNRIIKLFKEIRKTIREIFEMNVYGVFSYGRNKCKTMKSDSSNLFHTGILSHEFKKIFEIENICRKLKKDKKGDVYTDDTLYHSFRYYVRKNGNKSSIEQSEVEWGISKEDIDEAKESKNISEKNIIVFKISE